GFFRAYVEGSDDPDAAIESQDAPLPPLTVGEAVDCRDLEAVGHETKPPARYTEATLVKALEAEGIGRPSTYATIIDTIQERGYCFKLRKELAPTFTAFAVTELMEEHFDELVDLKFTANMEQQLDDIANGETDYLAYLRRFFLGADGLESQVRTRDAEIDPRTASTVTLGDLNAEVRIGQFGPFVAKEENGERLTASLPPDLAPADLTDALVEEILHHKLDGPRVLGPEPESGLPVLLKKGPFGPYVQLGEDDPGSKAKPKRVSLLKTMQADGVDLALALDLLRLPRTLGEHPDTGKPVQAGIGRFGPFVLHDGVFANLKAGDDVLEIDLGRALELLAEKKGGRSRSGAAVKSVLVELGEHPSGGAVQVLDGRYGPYVNWGKVNVTLPKDIKPADVDLGQALAWIADKAAQGPAKKGATKRNTAAKPAAAKKPATTAKPATKKPAAKKTAAKKPTTKKAATTKTAAKK
ncbi:MAG: DNA topoisomerase I, partial [Caldilineaceae bacterium]|nr:DNA topoisomerase I [Caldilineaceae bacterium]